MKIDDAAIDHLARLAHLEFDAQQKEEIRKDLDKILGFVELLNEVDTDGIEPLIYMTEGQDKLREDVVDHEISQKEALSNAPDKDSDYFKVPKVLDRSKQ